MKATEKEKKNVSETESEEKKATDDEDLDEMLKRAEDMTNNIDEKYKAIDDAMVKNHQQELADYGPESDSDSD